MRLNEIRIRDPYILTHEGVYYLYGTFMFDIDDNSLRVIKSTDLIEWQETKIIFTIKNDSWAQAELWAPEVHFYNGRFYLFVSILGKNGIRGTQIAVCDTPDGMFTPIVNAPATPVEHGCIDGTLYVEDGIPYIVYSADWPDNYDDEKGCYCGKIHALRLSPDLKASIGDPFELFSSEEAPCSKGRPAIHDYLGKTVTRYGSDGPFLLRLSDNSLVLTWSPIPDMNYIVAAAVSRSGSIKGKWEHISEPIYDKNGGHAMFFKDKDDKLKMVIHNENWMNERTLIFDIEEENGVLKVKT